MSDQRAVLEFSRFVKITALDANGSKLFLSANDGECKALAGRLGLISLSKLHLEVFLRLTNTGSIRLNVKFSANVLQSCVVSLDPVAERVADQFSVLCKIDGTRQLRKTAQSDVCDEVVVDPFEEDLVEVVEDGKIDVGELAAQHLSLSLNPYPRASGNEERVELACPEYDIKYAGGEKERENPFSVLAGYQDDAETNGCG